MNPSPFASDDLVLRIEAAEARLVYFGASVITTQRPDLGGFVYPFAGGIATFTRPGSPVNKIAGCGLDGEFDLGELEELEAEYAARDTAVQFELASHADPRIAAELTQRGYTLQGFENVLVRELSPAAGLEFDCPAEIQVRDCTDEPSDAWLDMVVRGFATPDTQGTPSPESHDDEDVVREVLADFIQISDLRRYAAFRNDQLAGGASMRIDRDWTEDGISIAQLAGATTLPEHRRNGVQTSLLAHRLAAATARCCQFAVVTTMPGSKSHENAHRHGFQLLYNRAVLVKS